MRQSRRTHGRHGAECRSCVMAYVSRMCRESVQNRSVVLQGVEWRDCLKSVLRRRFREMSGTVARCLRELLIRLSNSSRSLRSRRFLPLGWGSVSVSGRLGGS